jgi:two-component system, cell cycle response regulator
VAARQSSATHARPGLAQHASRVANLAVLTARQLGVTALEIERIRLAALLHDVGKTALPDSLLSKPGPLDPVEWELMRTHTLIGERIVCGAAPLAHTAGLVRSSHERFDGDGYPDGLSGNQIPQGSRIIAVCDAFDAMTNDRPYRRAVSSVQALLELRRVAGMQFDVPTVNAFCIIARRA